MPTSLHACQLTILMKGSSMQAARCQADMAEGHACLQKRRIIGVEAVSAPQQQPGIISLAQFLLPQRPCEVQIP